MKTTIISRVRRPLRRILFALGLGLLAAPVVRAGLTMEMNVVRYDPNGFYFSPNLTTNFTGAAVPFGYYNVVSPVSPNAGAWALYQFDTNGFNQIQGYPIGYNDYNSMMHDLTNGNWTIYFTNSVMTNIYYFTVTPHISSNDLPVVSITSPPNGAVNVTNLPTFTWQGPTNYNGLVIYGFNFGINLPPSQTNVLSPRVLYQGANSFTVHYDSNSPVAVVSSVPVDNSSQPIGNWTSTSHLQDYYSVQFSVGLVDTTGTSHVLVAHYAWDATNSDGTASGEDTSGNGYNMNFGAGFGLQGGANSTTDSAAGPRAIQFHDGDANSGGVVGWNPTPAGLLTALAGSFSVSCWIKTTQTSAGGWNQAPAYYGAGIISADNSGQANDVVPIALTGNTIGFNTGGDSEDVTLNSTASVNDGNYHHVVVTRNQQTGQKIIYIDGVLDSFSSGTTNPLSDPQKLTIGALADASDPNASDGGYYQGFDGELDDVQIYSGVLSAANVASLFANPGSTVPNGGGLTGGHRNVAHYAFDDSSNLGKDSSPNGNNMSGPVTWGPWYQFSTDAEAGGGAVQFFGTSALYASGQTLTNLNAVLAGSFTFSTWVKTTITNGTDYNNAFYGATIFWAYNDRGNTNDTIPLSITGNKAAFTTRGGDSGVFDNLHSITSVNDGNYHMITVTRDQSSGQKKIYVDGNLDNSDIDTTDPLNGNNYNLTIGGYAYASDGTGTNFYAYKGLLDDLQVYIGVLSDAEVASLYANPGSTVPDVVGVPGGPVVHYDFDEGTVLAADVSGNDNNMVYASNFGGNGPVISSDAAAGSGSVSFDGGSYLTASSNLLSTLAGEFSVSLWLKTSQYYGNPGNLAWQGAGVISADSPNFGAKDLIPVALTGGQVAFNIGDGNSDDTLNSTGTVNNGAWRHVVVTRSLSTGLRQIYIDGLLDSSEVSSTVLLNSPVLLTIGAKSDASDPDPASPSYNGSNGYQGLLDDIQIYNRVLSAQEVAYLHQNPGAVVGGAGADFATALNTTNLTWNTGGDADWFVQSATTHDGLAAQSGVLTDNSKYSSLQTTVTGPGTLTFWWSSAANDSDFDLEFDIDGGYGIYSDYDDLYGNTSWTQDTFTIPDGVHTLTWFAYDADLTSDAGYLDQVSYVAAPPSTNTAPIITVNPFSQTNYPGYSVALYAAATSNPTATWQWFKVGSGLISAATNTLFIPTNSGTVGVAGSYYAVASNLVGSATTLTAAVTFVSAALPPDWTLAFKAPLANNSTDATTNYNIACLLDSTGTNIYTVGSFVGTNTFGADTLISANGGFETSFLKQTTTGTPIWGRAITNNGNGSSYAQSIAAAPGGGFYVAGNIFGTNWLGTNLLVDTAGASTYLARFNANGSNLWVRTITGTNGNFTTYHMLASDPAGNVTLSALISGGTSFGTTNLYVAGQQGVLVQYDASGNIRWLQIPSSWPNYLTYSGGRVYGAMGGTAINYIGGVTNLSNLNQALFAINATNGQGFWVQGIGATQGQGSPTGFGDNNSLVAVSGTNVFVAGSAYGTNAVFGSFTVTFPAAKGQFFARYDTNGNAQLATSFGSQFTWPWAVGADASGNVYVGGDFDTYSVFGSNIIAAPFYETVQFINTLDNRIPGQGFLAKFDRNGNPLWARYAESQSSYLNSRDLAVAADGVWSCGFFNQQSVFGSITINGGLTVVGSPFGIIYYHPSGFLAKITDGVAGPLSVNLLNPQNNGANFQFQFLSQSGFTHSILYRTNLTAGSWQTNSTVTGDSTLKTITLPFSLFGPAKQGFIRVSTQ